ncbi:MAG: aquaporin [Candidatus Kuenenia sp.]|nr:aquaporin [Candidatus Kuenenia hertensis]
MDSFKKYIAEFLGTFTLVFIAAGAVCTDYYLQRAGGAGIGVLGISIAYGLAIVSITYALSYISGAHINPAVTIACWITRRMNPNTAINYIIAQIAGAALAGFVLKTLFPEAMYTVHLGTSTLGDEVSVMQGLVMEFIISFLLVLTIFGTAIDKRSFSSFSGLTIGLVVLFGVLISSPISSGAMNPARAFGPAIASGQFSHHYIWWIGPVFGGIAAAFFYDVVFAEKRKKETEARKTATRTSRQKKKR